MRHAQIFTRSGANARLSYYSPGTSMAQHHHASHQLSCLLVGEFLEVHAGRELEVCQPSVGVKPAGLEHLNEYGPNGALILSINLEPSRLDEYLPEGSGPCLSDWRWRAGQMATDVRRSALALTRIAAEAGEGVAQGGNGRDGVGQDGDLICDLLAVLTPDLTAPAKAQPPSAMPLWLARARDALRESETAPDIKDIADEAGVHRVHLSRAFSGQFGVPPSLYRRRCRLARAIADMLRGATLADAAHGAGFADQSHFSRFAKTETGYSPHRLKTLLAAA